ncbi:hypothetical protein RF11_12623 [Thelohanellus kitauei]|uniref:Uncharacterized protein n=1 Tax=Thelohanellus kitauei TaxID=669202 RepID=A0A0C2MS05_THEKT|nr:hypothetical protein RF11_12623 [Thelohanellus kitauei]
MVSIFIKQVDHYLQSSDTQKGKQHCVRRDSKTEFLAEHVHQVALVNEPGQVTKQGGLNIFPSNWRSESAIGEEITFQMSVKPVKTTKLNIYFLVHLTENLKAVTDNIVENLEATRLGINLDISERSERNGPEFNDWNREIL